MREYIQDLILTLDRTPNWWIALVSSAVIFTLLLAMWIGVRVIKAKLIAKNPDRFVSDAFEALSQTSLLFLIIVSLYVPLTHLDLPANLRDSADLVFTIAMVLQGASWVITTLIQLSTTYVRNRAAKNPALPSALFLIKWALRTVIWSVAMLVLLDNIGVDVTALIAGLGVGGIALGLAAQGLFKDLLGSLAIVLDRPFVIGDFITLDTVSGTVEEIGMKTTRLRSQTGEEIIVPNADLLGGQIHNFRRMKQRTVTFRLPLDYANSAEKISLAKDIVEAAVRRQDSTEFMYCAFREYQASALSLETAYKVRSRVFTDFLRIQDAINLEIKSAYADNEIEFIPTVQRVRLENGASPPVLPAG
jgi:small-conductance mechanosensitive channel